MKKTLSLKHKFVRCIPDQLEIGTVYISLEFATAAHLCCCGCGNEVITPLSPTDWRIIFNGESVSLEPSVGNWNFPCQSHYWIRHNKVAWANHWSLQDITANRRKDYSEKKKHYRQKWISDLKKRFRQKLNT